MISWMKGGEGLSLEGGAGGLVGDDAGVKVHAHQIPRLDGVGRGLALQDGQADVDAVAVENPGEALGDDHRDAAGLDAQGGVLTGGAAAEVPGRPTITSPGCTLRTKSLSMSSMQWEASSLASWGVQVPGRDDDVGVDVVGIFENMTFCVHCSVLLSWSDGAGVGDGAGEGPKRLP